MYQQMLVEPRAITAAQDTVIFDCRFSLADPEEGRADYLRGHIPGAHYLDLNQDLSASEGEHGGRHPLPTAADFAATLARFGVTQDSAVIAYDDSRFAYASRLWWMVRSLGFRPPRLLNGGYQDWLQAGGEPDTIVPQVQPAKAATDHSFAGCCDIEGLRRAQGRGALLVDSREEGRYLGREEPIDPVAGHIPGAVNRPWQGVTDTGGAVRDRNAQLDHWGDAREADELVVYCGSGVTACVNLFSLALLGRDDATLYAGSWSDWCSWLS